MTDRFPQLAESTLPAVLLHRARRRPEGLATAICHIDKPDEPYSIAQLLALADCYARAYRARATPGGPALICVCLYHGVHLHAAFVGALLAGQIPAMIAPPSPRMEQAKYVGAFQKMLAHMHPDLVVIDHAVIEALRELSVEQLPDSHRIDAGEFAAPPAATEQIDLEAIAVTDVSPSDVALLQHSSGTTGLQKGVALTHQSILNQVRSYARTIDLTEADAVASWLPLYHDMGLIACFLMPLLTGTPIIQLSQFDWVNQPALLPRKIHEHGATLCWLPNFAYSFMSRSIRDSQLENADFHSIRAFINCSEPVMPATHREFAARFAAQGVTPAKLTACYAMAENVFAVTQSPVEQAPRVDRICKRTFEREHRAVAPASPDVPAVELVSNGPVMPGVEVKVIDDLQRDCAERQVGEICIRGESLFSGYFRRDDLTQTAFLDDWYKTGDLGYLADGELYVTGRKKDLIIIQGRNFYPADIEAEVAEIDGLIPGRIVAFGDTHEDSGTESLVIIAETEATDPAEQGRIKLEIRRRIAQAFDCTVGAACLVPPRWLIKSTAGKVARADNRRKYEELLKG